MLDRVRFERIAGLALPIMGGMVSQNVLNLVDTAMVGRLPEPNTALAAVGLGGFVLFMSQAVIMGISTGVQATASRRKGQNRLHETAVFLNAALMLVLLVAPVVSLILFFIAPLAYPYLNSDPELVQIGVPYLQIRLLAIVFVGMNYSFRGYWNAVDKAWLYMSTLLIMHTCNIVLNYMLIFGKFGAPALGVSGAAIGSALSTVVGSAVYVALGVRHARSAGFLKSAPRGQDMWMLVRLSVPSGVQQTFFAAGFVATFWIVGLVGTREVAAVNVLINVTLVAILPGLGLGLAAATLVGQSLGRSDPGDARQWGWDVAKVAVVVLGLLGLPMWAFPDAILGVFISDPLTLNVARWPMRLVGITMALEGFGLVFMSALQGAGDARRVMLVTVSSQWLLFLPLAYLVGPVLGYGLLAIWLLQAIYRSLQGFVFWRFWSGGAWARITI